MEEKIKEIAEWVEDESCGNFEKGGQLVQKINALLLDKDTEEHQRTLKQNNSIHLFCEHLAHEFNDRGITMQEILKHTIDINPTKDTVKYNIWSVIMLALFQKKSTTKQTGKEVDSVYEHINRFVAKNWQFHVPFPSVDNSQDINK